MTKLIMPLLVYLIVCIITIILPASDGYNTIGWKLLVGQFYAIPALIISVSISIFLNKNKEK